MVLIVPLVALMPLMFAQAMPSADQLAWQDLEIGMFVHFQPNTVSGKEYDDRAIDLGQLKFKNLNTDQWAQAASELGAKYVVFVAKHAGGFCNWQTPSSPYGLRQAAWENGHGDLMKDFSESCRKRHLEFGVYCSPTDGTFDAGGGGKCNTPAAQKAYDRVYREQLTELLSRYGPMCEVWFDGSIVVPVADILKKHAPHAMVFQGPEATLRWVGNEDGVAPDPCWYALPQAKAETGTATSADGDPRGGAWMPCEVDVSILRPYWFWSAKKQRNLMTLDQLMSVYYRSVGRGQNLLLNVPPDADGAIPSAEMAVCAAFGKEIKRRFSHPVGFVSGGSEAVWKKAHRVDTVVLAEDLRGGQNVLSFSVYGLSGGKWVLVGSGSAIGHKRILPIRPVALSGIRVHFDKVLGAAHLRSVAAFDTGVAPPVDWDK